MSTSNSRRLHLKLDLASGPRLDAYARLYAHPQLPRLFPSLLIYRHQIMRSSVSLLEVGHRRAREREAEHPLYAPLADYYGAHLAEERAHDSWMMEDLEASGFSRADVLARIPSSTVASLVGAQYYWVEHHDPLALLGYLVALESYPASSALLDTLQERSRMPAAAFRAIRMHAENDVGHRKVFDALLDSLPLRPEHEALLGVSAIHTTMSLALGVEELLATAS
jgi:hypothetical protein